MTKKAIWLFAVISFYSSISNQALAAIDLSVCNRLADKMMLASPRLGELFRKRSFIRRAEKLDGPWLKISTFILGAENGSQTMKLETDKISITLTTTITDEALTISIPYFQVNAIALRSSAKSKTFFEFLFGRKKDPASNMEVANLLAAIFDGLSARVGNTEGHLEPANYVIEGNSVVNTSLGGVLQELGFKTAMDQREPAKDKARATMRYAGDKLIDLFLPMPRMPTYRLEINMADPQ